MSLAEAEKHWKAAQKLTSASFLAFRLKSDWEQAGPLYEKAANAFRVRPSRLDNACSQSLLLEPANTPQG